MNKELYKTAWQKGMSYNAYRSLIHRLLEVGKTTGEKQTDALVEYTQLNVHRMNRIEKNVNLDDSLIESFSGFSGEVVMLAITEAWCGDAAQSLPVAFALSESTGIEMRVVLRDEHPELVDMHLTNGARSIPIILFLHAEHYEVLGQWGPRPRTLQEMVMDHKHLPDPKQSYDEFSKSVQLWYAKDKQKSMQQEWKQLLSELSPA